MRQDEGGGQDGGYDSRGSQALAPREIADLDCAQGGYGGDYDAESGFADPDDEGEHRDADGGGDESAYHGMLSRRIAMPVFNHKWNEDAWNARD